MKKFIVFAVSLSLIICFAGCGNRNQNVVNEVTDPPDSIIDGKDDLERNMKFYIGDREIPVVWEDNESVYALMEAVSEHEITVKMSMYSNNEQVGPLGRSYVSSDVQMTTHNGDIVLYNSCNIVVFYGSNTWAYTKLGKMQLSENEVTELLAHGDVIVKLN